MALVVTHAFTATAGETAGAAAAGKVVASEWNAAHTLSGFGTGVATALAVNVGSAGAFTTFNGALGTPSSGTLTNCGGSPTLTAVTSDAYKLSSSGIVTDSGTSRTLSASDNGAVLYFTSGSSITLSMASGLGAGFSCTVLQGGAGQITFAANSQTMTVAGGLTKTAYVGAMALIIAAAANTFFISGTLA